MKNSTQQHAYAPNFEPETEQGKSRFSFGGFHHDRELGGLKWVLRFQTLSMCVGALVIAALVGYTVLLKEREKVIPWFIEVSTSGQVRSIKMLGEQGFTPSEVVTQSYLKQAIQFMHEIPADGVKHRQQLTHVRSMLTSQASLFFMNFVKRTDPNKRRQLGEYVTATVQSMHKIAGSETFMVDWVTSMYMKGQTPKHNLWRGSFHIKTAVLDATDEKDVDLENPLQMEILNMNWDKIR